MGKGRGWRDVNTLHRLKGMGGEGEGMARCKHFTQVDRHGWGMGRAWHYVNTLHGLKGMGGNGEGMPRCKHFTQVETSLGHLYLSNNFSPGKITILSLIDLVTSWSSLYTLI